MPPQRWARWVENFTTRHGALTLHAGPGLAGEADDGSWFEATLPFGVPYVGPADPAAFSAAASAPADWGVLLVRRGGFAVARLSGASVVSSKVGQRHVQGRTKAGGQSQQRFARRRDNQARAAWEAAAGHAMAHLATLQGPLLVGGDAAGVESVVALAGLGDLDRHLLEAVPGEPRRAALEEAVAQGLSVRVRVLNA